MSRGRAGRAAVGLLTLALAASTGSAQSVDALATRCAAAGSSPDLCREAAVAARALQAHTGLLAGLGSEVPGSGSTLGRRLGSTPRVAGSLRAGGLQLRVPDLAARGEGPADELSAFVPTIHGSLTLGVFDGFSLLPTVGGFLSLDLIGQTSFLFLPESEGFGGRLGSISLGARAGIVRESFTLPGVSVSVSRRLLGSAELGDPVLGPPASIVVVPSVTSVRLALGKDLFAVGLLAGAGWDSYSGDVRLRVQDGGAGPRETEGEVPVGRALFFGGASLNFIVLQLSAELGWAAGLDSVPGYEGAPFDPTGGSLFGSLAFRLTL